jgi:hypothetical protein
MDPEDAASLLCCGRFSRQHQRQRCRGCGSCCPTLATSLRSTPRYHAVTLICGSLRSRHGGAWSRRSSLYDSALEGGRFEPSVPAR